MQAIDITQYRAPFGTETDDLPGAFDAACAWTNARLSAEELKVRLPGDALDELRALARDPKIYEGDAVDYRADLSKIPALRRVIERIRHRLDHGIGCALLDRLPVEEWDERQSTVISYFVSSLIGLPIEQKWKGARFYHVRDTGAQKGYGVRLSVTNFRFGLHTDGPWLEHLPQAITLSCLQQAETGGYSRLASLVTAHDRLRQRHPELLRRLYRDFWWDRQAEHEPGERLCNRLPVFEHDGTGVTCRFNESYIRSGYELLDERLDILGDEALSALREELDRPDSWVEFRMERGQMQFLNNTRVAHGRTAFEDAAGDPEVRRHMIRIWIRDGKGVTLEPSQPLI